MERMVSADSPAAMADAISAPVDVPATMSNTLPHGWPICSSRATPLPAVKLPGVPPSAFGEAALSQVVVGVADCRVSSGPDEVLTTYALGSCIGLAAHDPQASVGGLLHFMLPDSAIDPARGRERPFMFADTGVPMLFEQMAKIGASQRR